MSRGCVTVVVNGACEWCLLASHSVFPAAENAGAVTPRVGLLVPGDFRATMQRDIINRTLRGAENCKEALSALYFVFPFLLCHLFLRVFLHSRYDTIAFFVSADSYPASKGLK